MKMRHMDRFTTAQRQDTFHDAWKCTHCSYRHWTQDGSRKFDGIHGTNLWYFLTASLQLTATIRLSHIQKSS